MPRLNIELPETLPFYTELTVRIDDINYGHHLGHDSLVSLLHEARLRFLRHHGFSEADCGDGSGIVLASLEVAYQAEAFLGDTLVIAVGVDSLGRSGADLLYAVHRESDRQPIARARTGIVFFDYQTRRPRRVPQAFRERFGA